MLLVVGAVRPARPGSWWEVRRAAGTPAGCAGYLVGTTTGQVVIAV